MYRFSNQMLRKARNVSSRYISHNPLPLSKQSYKESFPPLTDPLPSLNHPLSLCNPKTLNPTKITTLPNGFKIASQDAPGPAACIGIYVNSGSIYESRGETGISHLLERLAFKDTKNRTKLQIAREIESIGGNVGALASREQMAYNFDVLKAHLPKAVELLADCVLNPVFLESEVKEQLANVRFDVEELHTDPQKFLMETINHAGYAGALSNPMLVTDENFDVIDGPLVEKFYSNTYRPDRMVLAASGVDHEFLFQIAEPRFRDLKEFNEPLNEPSSNWVGGEIKHKADSTEVTHVAVAFSTPFGWRQDKDATVITVLQTLMGGGGSFSTGGPGKGMYSRLYQRVLNQYHEFQSISAFSSLYNETGLFGVTFSMPSDYAERAFEIAGNELRALVKPGVTALELSRAKNATKSAILTNLESRSIIVEDIGRQILTYGERKPVEYFLECIDEMTVKDITEMSERIVEGPLALSIWGDVDSVPKFWESDFSISQKYLEAA